MIHQREKGFVMIIQEPALTRIKNGECPVCGKPKNEWTRRTDWRCCSGECTSNFESCCIIRSWIKLRDKVLERDNHTCVKCGKSPKKKTQDCVDGKWSWIDTNNPDDSKLIGDHIIPIALGGEQWDEDNIQTLCKPCDKIKTKKDQKDIARLRRKERLEKLGQKTLNNNL